jgi:hypothetical protein
MQSNSAALEPFDTDPVNFRPLARRNYKAFVYLQLVFFAVC